jgi:hypothetical protein
MQTVKFRNMADHALNLLLVPEEGCVTTIRLKETVEIPVERVTNGTLMLVHKGLLKMLELEDAPVETNEDLSSLRRNELNEIAIELGLDPFEYRNKSDIVDAIIAARSSN